MHWIDFTIVVVFMLSMLGLGLVLSRKAGKDTDEFILAGRSMPWWLAGTSVLATGLNASTMLQDSRKVREDGLGGLWFTWRGVIAGAVAAVFFNRLWRRARFVTQMEFYEARYAGKKAVVGRLFDTILYGMLIAPMWAAIGLVGMKKIASVLLGLEPTFEWLGFVWSTDLVVVLLLVVITLIYSAASGVYGVVWTDLVEAVIALVATYTLLVIVYVQVGGPTGLSELLSQAADSEKLTSLVPTAAEGNFWWYVLVIMGFYVVFSALEGGGYDPRVQRALCVKDERETIYVQLYSGIMNLAIKSWPFYVCGLAGLFLISGDYLLENFEPAVAADGTPGPDYERVFPALVKQYLPIGLVGMMVTGFLSAFMSSFDSNVHNSTSVFTNDLYRPYIAPGRSEKHYVAASRWYMVFATALATTVGILSNDILFLLIFIFGVMQSVGLIKLLRFAWWRANIWGELVAMAFSLLITTVIVVERILEQFGNDVFLFGDLVRSLIGAAGFPVGNDTVYVFRTLLMTTAATSLSVVAILLTPPEPMDKLVAFYERVRPFGFWGPVRARTDVQPEASDHLGWLIAVALSITATTLGVIFAMAGLLLAWWEVLAWSLVTIAAGLVVFFFGMKRLYPTPPNENATLPPAASTH